MLLFRIWQLAIRQKLIINNYIKIFLICNFFNSWHEIGARDLPAMIDYILEKTGNKKIFYIGHSQGTTSFFVMASELPEYNNKIISMHALAPVAYCSHITSPPFRFLSLIWDQLWVGFLSACDT